MNQTLALPAPLRLSHARLRRFARPASPRLPLECSLLLLTLTAAALGATWWPNSAWSIVATLNYAWMCTLIFRIEPRGAVLMLPYIISRASNMFALIMIEHGAEMFEIGAVGQPGPWSNLLNIYTALFWTAAILVLKPCLAMLDRRRTPRLSPVFDRFANLIASVTLALVGLLAAYLLFYGLRSGFPLIEGTDRFAYRRFAANKVTLYALNLKSIVGFVLGMVAFVIPARRWMRIAAGMLFPAMIVLYFLFGDKFFTQLAAMASFFAPYLYCNYEQARRRLGIYGLAGALALGTVGLVTTYIYSQGFTETPAATTKRLSGRMVGQGELWYLQSRIGAPLLRWDQPVLDRYVAALHIKQTELFAIHNSLGANYFSNRYAPDYLRASLHKNAGTVTYTAATEATGLVLFGWLGLGAAMLVIGLLVGLCCAYAAYAIATRSMVSALFAAYIYAQLRSGVVQAAPWTIFSIYSARWLSIILAIELALLVLGQRRLMSLPHPSRIAPAARPRRRRSLRQALRRSTLATSGHS